MDSPPPRSMPSMPTGSLDSLKPSQRTCTVADSSCDAQGHYGIDEGTALQQAPGRRFHVGQESKSSRDVQVPLNLSTTVSQPLQPCDGVPVQRPRRSQGRHAARTFAAVLRNIAAVLFPSAVPVRHMSNDGITYTSTTLLREEKETFMMEATPVRASAENIAKLNLETSRSCKALLVRGGKGSYHDARRQCVVVHSDNDFANMRQQSAQPPSINITDKSAFFSPDEQVLTTVGACMAPSGGRSVCRGCEKLDAYPQHSSGLSQMEAPSVVIPSEHPAVNVLAIPLHEEGLASQPCLSGAGFANPRSSGAEYATTSSQTGQSLQALGNGLVSTRHASTQTSQAKMADKPLLFTRDNGVCTSDSSSAPIFGPCTEAYLPEENLDAAFATAIGTPPQGQTDESFLPPGPFPPCLSSLAFPQIEYREETSLNGEKAGVFPKPQHFGSGSQEAPLLAEMYSLQCDSFEDIQRLSSSELEYQGVNLSAARFNSYPVYKENKAQQWHIKSANKGHLFPATKLKQHRVTGTGSMHSCVFKNILQRRYFSVPIIPTTMMFVEKEKLSGKKSASTKSLPSSVAEEHAKENAGPQKQNYVFTRESRAVEGPYPKTPEIMAPNKKFSFAISSMCNNEEYLSRRSVTDIEDPQKDAAAKHNLLQSTIVNRVGPQVHSQRADQMSTSVNTAHDKVKASSDSAISRLRKELEVDEKNKTSSEPNQRAHYNVLPDSLHEFEQIASSRNEDDKCREKSSKSIAGNASPFVNDTARKDKRDDTMLLLRTASGTNGTTSPAYRLLSASQQTKFFRVGGRSGNITTGNCTVTAAANSQTVLWRQHTLEVITSEDHLMKQPRRKVTPTDRSADKDDAGIAVAQNLTSRVQSFSISAVTKRTVGTQASIEENRGGSMRDNDPFIADGMRVCKNPMHKANSKTTPGNYCRTCKNPRHNPGHLAAYFQADAQKGASFRDCKNKKHQHIGEAIEQLSPAAALEARSPIVLVKSKTEGSTYTSLMPVLWKVALLVAAVIILLSLVYIIFGDFPPHIPPNMTTVRPPGGVFYCTTVYCDRESHHLKSLLSDTTGPCDDFYLHVCDKWVRSQILANPGTGAVVSSDSIIQDDLIANLEAALVFKKRRNVSVALALYDACTDRAQSSRAITAVAELFRQWKIGRWPTDALAPQKDAWFFAGELLKDIGLKALVDVFAAIDVNEPTKVAIGLAKPNFLFSHNDASRPAVINMFRDALMETVTAVSQASSQELIDEIMLVVTRLGSSPLERADSEIGMQGFDIVRLSDLHSGFEELLRATLGNVSSLRPETKVVLKSADYLQGHLATALRELPPRAVMNYMGFQAFIILAPFLLDRHRLLRQLFSKSFLGRTLPDVSNTSHLCLVAVERVLPGCFARMLHQPSTGHIVVNKLSQLVRSFAQNVEHLAWMDDMAVVLSRYLLKEYATSASGEDAPCPSSSASFAKDNSIKFFVSVFRDRQQRALKAGGGDIFHSQLLTFATHDVAGRRVHIPAALFNASVPANTSHFSLHFARFAVRFYRTLVEAVLRRDTVPTSLRYGDDPVRRFEDLLNCFEWELRQLPAALRQPIAPDSTVARGALLQQTVAVQLAFRAFLELLQIRRTWNLDFRFAQLPDLSVDQLFFVYYALDNCEAADGVYEEHRGQWLPARYRVNVPLRNVVEFAQVFGCPPHSNMVRFSFVPACTVVSVDQWLKSQPE